MKNLTIILLLLFSKMSYAQRVIYDKYQFGTVNANGAARQAAEISGHAYYDKVNKNLEKVKINAGTVVLAQTMIYNSLSNVNSALKNGRTVIAMGNTVQRIVTYSNYMLTIAKDEPYLILFAEQMASEAKTRALRLVTEISSVVLKEGNNILMDYNARDELLLKINQELMILEGLTYGGYSAMMQVKQAGVLKTVMPFSGFIANDKSQIRDIVYKYQNLKQK